MFSHPITTTGLGVDLKVPHDGIFYFKIAPLKNGVRGAISTLVLKVDTTSPDVPTIRVSSLKIKKGEVVRLELSSHDDLSGLEKNFYISSDDSIWVPSFSKLYIPFHEVGVHKLGVRVFDNAQNYSDSQVIITVTK
jgi:hypothetical protein